MIKSINHYRISCVKIQASFYRNLPDICFVLGDEGGGEEEEERR
jgi:hypothetical protein